MNCFARFLLLLVLAFPSLCWAQTPPKTYSLTITDQQMSALVEAGARCLDKVPYACAEYMVSVRTWLLQAKPVEDKKPDEPKK